MAGPGVQQDDASTAVDVGEQPADDGEPDFKPKRSKAGLAIALAMVLLAGALAAFFALRPTREPLRILIAVDAEGQWWDGSTTAARLLDGVVPHLKKLGFEPVDGGDAEIVKKLSGAATPEEAARRVEAAFIVTGALKIETTELGQAVGMVELRASGPILLAHYDGTAHEVGHVHTWSGANDKAEAVKLAAQSLGPQTFDVLLPGLMAHEAVQAIVKGSDTIAAGKLTAAKAYLEKRDSQLTFAKTSYRELEQKLAQSDRSPTKVTLHGPLNRQDGLCAIGANGFFARSSAVRPFYSPSHEGLGYFRELEKLYWQDAEGKQRVVFEGYNVLGYASGSPDGTTAVYVEDLYGAATALEVVRGTEPAKRVYVDAKLRLSEPKVAPGGGLAAAWGRECSRCPSALIVVDLKSGKELYRSDPKQAQLGGFVWLGPARLGVLLRSVAPAAGTGDEDDDEEQVPSQSLQSFDFAAGPMATTTLGSVSGAAQLSLPTASGDGKRVIFTRYADDGMNLALYDETSAKLEPLPVARASEPALSPAGDKVAFVRGGEIEIYDLATQQTRSVTTTGDDYILRYPQFSLDGKRVYFEVRAKDPVFPKDRTVSAVGSVPVP